MHDVNFIIREPLLDPKQRVVGYELTWQHAGTDAAKSTEEELHALAIFVGDQFTDPDSGWRLPDTVLFLEVTPALLVTDAVQALPPASTVLTLDMSALADSDTLEAVKALRTQGFGISLRNADMAAQDQALLAYASHLEIRLGVDNFAAQVKAYSSLKQAPVRIVARQVNSWQEYDSCAGLGLDTFVGSLCLTPRPGGQTKGLNPAQTLILQLMEMVRQNADVRQLEGALKRDAALSYKLFRYINSVGFGLGAEIQSLRHAVTMLGYSPLYRWLSLLLATASTSGHSPVLMQTAIIRGRFAELLGKGFLPKSEAENLFVSGMFSLLDRLLGITMEEALENIQLSEAVSQALLSRDGMYGPFLALAEACELNNGRVEDLADSLFISARQVNEAHLAALAWAQNLKI